MLQAYFSKMPAKICSLRVDTLAIMLSMANVGAHAQVRCPPARQCVCQLTHGFKAKYLKRVRLLRQNLGLVRERAHNPIHARSTR